MKKYISILVVVMVAFISSCSNDEITISNGISVKVDPSGVIVPFTYEINTGELASFSTSYKLRTRVLLYNEKGLLAAADSAFLTNYAGLMNSKLFVSAGSYTLLAVTDVVQYKNDASSLEYWHLTGINDINTLKITDAGMIGGKNKILGVASQQIKISSGLEEFTLRPQAAGALFVIEYYNIHHFSDVTEYKFQSNRSCNFLAFNSVGDYLTTPENRNNQYSWRNSYVRPQESSYASINFDYDYSFTFPMNNVSYRYVYSTNSVTDEPMTGDLTITSLNAGDEYVFQLDLCNEDYDDGVTYWYGKVNGASASSIVKNLSKDKTSNLKSVSTAPVESMRVVDLLKIM